MTVAEIAAALGKPRREGRGWKCLCPCHNDRDPSLSITLKDGKLLVRCRVGCDQTALVNELKQRGLWPNGHDPRNNFRIVASYDYHDEAGKLLFQVCRLHPKTFRQRRPDSKGGWEWSTNGTRMVPYRLPELLAAAAKRNGHPPRVYIVEGEEDADQLKAQWGLLATTNPGGAGKWRNKFAQYFSGLDVIILPDNDEAGQKHAHTVARNLTPVAASVRLVALGGLPEKGDVSDWIAAGALQSDLETLVELAPAFVPPPAADDQPPPNVNIKIYEAADVLSATIPPREWLLGNIFCKQFISSLVADGGVGKTALRIVQALSTATGRSLTGEYVHKRCRVLFLTFEDGRTELMRRLRAAMRHHGVSDAEVRGWLFFANGSGHRLIEENGHRNRVPGTLEDWLRQKIHQFGVELVIFDPFIKTHGVEENDNTGIDAVCVLLAKLAIELDIAVDYLHHARKGPSDPGNADVGRGASSAKDAARLVYTLNGMTKEEALLFNLQNEALRRNLVRQDGAKLNIAPPATDTVWFKLVGVPLNNGTPAYPNGDVVQTVERWWPPDMWKGIDAAMANRILDELIAGEDGDYVEGNPV